MDIQKLRLQHAEILGLSGEIRGMMSLPNRSAAADLLCQRLDVLTVSFSDHLALEDAEGYPDFLLSKSEKARTVSERFFIEMGRLRQTFFEYRDEWRTNSAIKQYFQKFQKDTERILAQFEERFSREEGELYPLWDAELKLKEMEEEAK